MSKDITTVLGCSWGDEGKSRIIDYLASQTKPNWTIRFHGGSNAGHTVINQYGKFVFHSIPSGIFEGNCYIGPGCVINLKKLVKEIESLEYLQVPVRERLRISTRAHIVTPQCIEEDDPSGKIGSTKQGIGPTYTHKSDRSGLRMGDLFEPNWLAERVDSLETLQYLYKYTEEVEDLILDVPLNKYDSLLLEGQLGIMRDIDWGDYPYVTSSSLLPGRHIGCDYPTKTIGVTKAYVTMVGKGLCQTEMEWPTQRLIQERGHEYGATTGRSRTCGWLNIPELKYAVNIMKPDSLALTKLDVLTDLKEILVCPNYGKYTGKRFPPTKHQLIVYKTFPSWEQDITGYTKLEQLPKQARALIDYIEEQADTPIEFISTGPERNQLIVRDV